MPASELERHGLTFERSDIHSYEDLLERFKPRPSSYSCQTITIIFHYGWTHCCCPSLKDMGFSRYFARPMCDAISLFIQGHEP